MSELNGFRVAVLATDGFEDSELTEPVKALREAGAQVTILSPKPGEIQGVRHDIDKTIKVKVDRTLKGDRLPQRLVGTGGPVSSSPTRSLPRKVPLGCDRAFSPAVDPAYAHVFGRCAA